MPIPSAVVIELTDEERSVLESWTRRHTSAQALALRARIVLAAAGSLTNLLLPIPIFFIANVSMMGGTVLLFITGAGRYALDAMLQRKP